MYEAIEKWPHSSAMEWDAMTQLNKEVYKTVTKKLAQLVLWKDIKDPPQPILKFSTMAMIPHKLCEFQLIYNLSFWLGLNCVGLKIWSTMGQFSQHLSVQ
jgi:hypothetical protein